VSLTLNAGVPATEVARRAGHSVAVLLKIYAHFIEGQADAPTSASATPSAPMTRRKKKANIMTSKPHIHSAAFIRPQDGRPCLIRPRCAIGR
jgi:hypothetical protein